MGGVVLTKATGLIGYSPLMAKERRKIDLDHLRSIQTMDLSDFRVWVTEQTNARGVRARALGPDLSYTDLAGADLSDLGLSYADLSYSDLSGADLSGTDLTGANLFRADLTGADLHLTHLTDADLTEADLSGTDLRFAFGYRSPQIADDEVD